MKRVWHGPALGAIGFYWAVWGQAQTRLSSCGAAKPTPWTKICDPIEQRTPVVATVNLPLIDHGFGLHGKTRG